MDHDYGTEIEGFRDEIKGFLDDTWPLSGSEADLLREQAAALFRERAVGRGYLYRRFPKRYGGSEQPPDVLKAQVIREEFGARRAPQEDARMGTAMLAPTLLEHGTDWQKEMFVKRTGRPLTC